MANWEEIEDRVRALFESSVQDVTTVGTIVGSVFSMDATDNSLNRSSGSFLTDGLLSQFKVTAAGFTEAGNNVSFRTDSATATKVVLSGATVTTEAEGDSVTLSVLLPVHYPNMPRFTPPGARLNWLWAALSVNWDSDQVSGGSTNRFRHAGLATAEFFAPKAMGTDDINALCRVCQTAFRAQTVNGITYRTPSLGAVSDDGTWFKKNVSIPFYSDEVVAA